MFNTAQEVREFTLAGKATLTLQSEKTGAHFTYKVRQATDKRTGEQAHRWFVSVLNGPDNEHSFAYIGLLDMGTKRTDYLNPNGPVQFRQTAKARFGADTPSVRGFVYFWNAVSLDKMPGCMKVRHDGKCGRCGRKLTTPESLDRGIGPECAGRMGMSVAKSDKPSSDAEVFEMPPRRADPVMAAFAASVREYI